MSLMPWLQTYQRKLHESLGDLEDLNKQYRHLAREGRTDTAGELRQMVHDVNDKWDELAQRTASIIRRSVLATGPHMI